MHDADDRLTESDNEPRRELAVAFGIGTSFIGAALVVLAVTSSAPLAALVFVAGVAVTITILRRHRRQLSSSPPAPQFVKAVEQAIIDLRTEAEATQSVLRRAAERRLELESPTG